MKTIGRISIIAAVTCITAAPDMLGERLVLLHTNDTHSQIDPLDNGQAGALRRKVLIDSVRNAEPNTLLIDAGDAVQGTLFFNLYKGEAEHKVMNLLGYDLAILGNHDFDNGSEELARNLKNDNATWLSTNYDLAGGVLEPYFKPYDIRRVGNRRVGFIAINLDPKGMISEGNYNGVKYLDAIKAANATAWHLKHNEKVDKVVAITHIGYKPTVGPGDVELASKSEDIDVIIGGHSHTTIDPLDRSGDTPWRVVNAVGDTVVVAQTGKSGKALGMITIDFDNGGVGYSLLPVDSRLDSRIQPQWQSVVEPYRHGVDSLMNVKIGNSPVAMPNDGQALLNLTSDFVKARGRQLRPEGVDLAIINKGGLRRGLPKGAITQGMIMSMMPFDNRVEVLALKGSDLKAALDVMAARGGDGVSREVDVVMADGKSASVTVNGKPLDPDKTYHVATIDYLAKGGDYMEPLTRGTVEAKSGDVLYNDFIAWIKANGRGIKADNTKRMRP